MYIKKIDIHNYKGFLDATIELHPKLNVFIGNNASGKTTLLSALIKVIYNITKDYANRPELKNVLNLKDDDINYSQSSCYITCDFKDFPNYVEEFSSAIYTKNAYLANHKILQPIEASKLKFTRWLSNIVGRGPITLPIFKYYPANRGAITYTDLPDSSVYIISQFEAWANVYQNNLSYSRFFNWFFDHETNELRLQRDANDFNIENPVLKGVRFALKRTFELLGYGEVKVKTEQIQRRNSSKLTPTLIIESLKTGKKEQIENKSDGEKAIITLIADIAYNLSLAKDFTIDNEFLNSLGIVLIDEIESHLHPNWQREIIPILTQLFPNIQFFIATHSPQVISSVNSESVFMCQDFQPLHVELKTKGEDTNSLLKFIFNSTDRPKEYITLINKFHYLIENKSEYAVIEELINKIDDIEKQDKSTDINSLIEELKLQLEAYKFEREHETNK